MIDDKKPPFTLEWMDPTARVSFILAAVWPNGEKTIAGCIVQAGEGEWTGGGTRHASFAEAKAAEEKWSTKVLMEMETTRNA